MVKYLLDTDAASDLIRGVPNVQWRCSCEGQTQICISAITVNEIEYGRRRNSALSKRRSDAIDEFLSQYKVIPFREEEAYLTGKLRAGLARVGTPIGSYDVMIAATALARGLILVTANTREFERVPNLRIEDWRSAPLQVREDVFVYRLPRWAA